MRIYIFEVQCRAAAARRDARERLLRAGNRRDFLIHRGEAMPSRRSATKTMYASAIASPSITPSAAPGMPRLVDDNASVTPAEPAP